MWSLKINQCITIRNDDKPQKKPIVVEKVRLVEDLVDDDKMVILARLVEPTKLFREMDESLEARSDAARIVELARLVREHSLNVIAAEVSYQQEPAKGKVKRGRKRGARVTGKIDRNTFLARIRSLRKEKYVVVGKPVRRIVVLKSKAWKVSRYKTPAHLLSPTAEVLVVKYLKPFDDWLLHHRDVFKALKESFASRTETEKTKAEQDFRDSLVEGTLVLVRAVVGLTRFDDSANGLLAVQVRKVIKEIKSNVADLKSNPDFLRQFVEYAKEGYPALNLADQPQFDILTELGIK